MTVIAQYPSRQSIVCFRLHKFFKFTVCSASYEIFSLMFCVFPSENELRIEFQKPNTDLWVPLTGIEGIRAPVVKEEYNFVTYAQELCSGLETNLFFFKRFRSGADFKISNVKVEWTSQLYFSELGFKFQGCNSGLLSLSSLIRFLAF